MSRRQEERDALIFLSWKKENVTHFFWNERNWRILILKVKTWRIPILTQCVVIFCCHQSLIFQGNQRYAQLSDVVFSARWRKKENASRLMEGERSQKCTVAGRQKIVIDFSHKDRHEVSVLIIYIFSCKILAFYTNLKVQNTKTLKLLRDLCCWAISGTLVACLKLNKVCCSPVRLPSNQA